MEPTPMFLTVREVAARFKLNPITIYAYIRSGELKAVRFGRYYRLNQKALDEFTANHAVRLGTKSIIKTP